jgi:DNA-binding MarR family transcriptional regulator
MAAPKVIVIPQEDYVLEILRAARLIEAEGERLFHRHDLSLAQFNVINILAYQSAMPQSELKKILLVGKATVSSVLAGLLARKLITQNHDAKDRRARLLSLSARGRELWKKANIDYVKNLQERLPGVSLSEVKLIQAALVPCAKLVPTA